jgi:hypothetical protein
MNWRFGLIAALICAAGALLSTGASAADVVVKGPPKPSEIEKFAVSELRAAVGRLPGNGKAVKLTVVVGRPASNPEVKRLLDSGFTKPQKRAQGYALKYAPEKGLALVAGADERGTLYGTMDFIHYHLPAILKGAGKSAEVHAAPNIEYRGCWLWGHSMKNYHKFLDQMARWKMNMIISWHRKFPPLERARDFQEYAAKRGITLVWGYSWGWPSGPKWTDPKSIAECSRNSIKRFAEEFGTVKPWGVYFQSHTEYGSGARYGPQYVDFVNRTAAEIFKRQPGVQILAGMHGTFQNQSAVKQLDPRVDMIYEDLGGNPFSYIAISGAARRERIKKACLATRGDAERVGFVFKGFCQAMAGGPLQLETDEAKLQRMADGARATWWAQEMGWRKTNLLSNTLGILQDLADCKAKRKTVTMLVEGGCFDVRAWHPVVLVSEVIWDPHRKAEEVIALVDSCPDVYKSSSWRKPRTDTLSYAKRYKIVDPAGRGRFGKLFGRSHNEHRFAWSGGQVGALTDGILPLFARDIAALGGYPVRFEAVLDLERKTGFKKLSFCALEDTSNRYGPVRAPKRVSFAVSDDGKDFKPLGELTAGKVEWEKPVTRGRRKFVRRLHRYTIEKPGTCRYVRVAAENPEPKNRRVFIQPAELEVE